MQQITISLVKLVLEDSVPLVHAPLITSWSRELFGRYEVPQIPEELPAGIANRKTESSFQLHQQHIPLANIVSFVFLATKTYALV